MNNITKAVDEFDLVIGAEEYVVGDIDKIRAKAKKWLTKTLQDIEQKSREETLQECRDVFFNQKDLIAGLKAFSEFVGANKEDEEL